MTKDVWGMDFLQDRTADGRPFRMLVLLDEYTRECLVIEVVRNFRGEDIVSLLDELTEVRVALAHLRAYNGREMISKAVKAWYLIDQWRLFYDHPRVQRARGRMTPAAFATACTAVPPLRLDSLDCARATSRLKGVSAMHQLS